MNELETPLDDPIAFWEHRHADLGPWRSGGDRGISNEENHEFYAYRLGRLIELMRRHGSGERRQRILDVGCGRGHFVHSLRLCGHEAFGLDTSDTAITWARETYAPERPELFQVSAIETYRSAQPFAVVLCIDVLFHVLEDDLWRAFLAGLSRHAAAESLLILTDVMGATSYPIKNYIRHRSRAMYEEAMHPMGFRCIETSPYAFGANPNHFAVFRRSY